MKAKSLLHHNIVINHNLESSFQLFFSHKNHIDLTKTNMIKSGNNSFYDKITPQVYFTQTAIGTNSQYFSYSLFDKTKGHDFNQDNTCEIIYASINKINKGLLLVDNILQYLTDPLPFLFLLKKTLLLNNNKCIIKLSPNEKGYYDFSLNNWKDFLEKCGFYIDEENEENSYIKISLSKNFHDDFIKNIGLNPKADFLVVTSEHPVLAQKTGGIGSYVQELEALLKEKVQIFYWGELSKRGKEALKDIKYFSPKLPASLVNLTWKSWGNLDTSYKIFYYVRLIKFYNPNIKLIEFADYLGLGARTIQAKKSNNILSSDIKIRVYCHGNEHYLQKCSNKWSNLGYNDIGRMLSERISLTQADELIFPTNYLKKLYESYDLCDAVDEIKIHRYPLININNSETSANINFTAIKKIVFFGKRNIMKGYDKTLKALLYLHKNNLQLFKNIESIVFIGPSYNLFNEDFVALSQVSKNIEEYEFTRAECLKYFSDNNSNSLILIPYVGDNHPVSVLEVIHNNCQLLALNAGGIPEMIPTEFHDAVLFEHDEKEFAKKISQCLSMEAEERKELVNNLLLSCKSQQNAINLSYLNEVNKIISNISTKECITNVSKSQPCTLVIPFYNTNKAYLRELFESIENQTYNNLNEIIIIDDASEIQNTQNLIKFIEQWNSLPIKLISHKHNKGLAAARNTGVKASTNELIVCIDSDDILLPDGISNLCNHMMLNPECSIASGILVSFNDDNIWNKNPTKDERDFYLALNPSIIAGSIHNYFGHAQLIVRKSVVEETGGWDEEDRSMWEDWAYYLKLACANKRIDFVAKPCSLYRIHKNSMSRTYKVFPAEKRLARSISTLSPFDANILINYISNIRNGSNQSISQIQEGHLHKPSPWAHSGKWEGRVLKFSFHLYHKIKKLLPIKTE
jgi:glycosyltransferase involved in cell wall biosynthesis